MRAGWVKEPILIFCVIGFLLFALPSSEVDPHTIIVDRATLIRFIENRTKNFTGSVEAGFDELSAVAVQDALKQYVREEALYRKALALGLDNQDYVIRQRLVQRVEYLSEGEIVSEPNETDLRAFYESNIYLFEVSATVTFTHVFFSYGGSAEKAKDRAMSMLSLLRSDGVRFEQAPSYGERFLYQRNYVETSLDEIDSHFGDGMWQSLFSMKPSEGWQGPISSEHGYHVVMLIDKREAFVENFEAVQSQIRTRWLVENEEKNRNKHIEDTVAEYQVILDGLLKNRIGEHRP